MMLGLTFWKHVIGTRPDAARDDRATALGRHRVRSRTLVLTSAAVAFAAIAFGAPVVGISVFLLTTLPFVLSGT
ncbi:hypothetical protein E2P84_41550 [Burkholderia cepacia]|uniref:Uncharacterized protein n=3 Tax=Burkholderia TaxID=32008 RepID=A0A107SEX3_BURCE|nr:hypothetical protein APZ15_21760 [Burkholderia cepacia ATCC 25416]AOI87067.1 hypothetical protein WI67_19655 [Burkholderia cepacia]KML44345.1 hypothetical protein VL13_05915 [Burkholderia lata]KMN52474.1 hypothetical protein VK92_32560 [Burkholderia sp. LK4]MBW5805175.1 hypothetical protein [Burkholderia sp. COPS]MCR5895890.1 hypothetical protein [Burkholderia sp. HAN2018]OUE47128.1 hypothetical protein BZY94_06445 [Burkholderia territorii]RBB36358.1 hypothetical protein DPV79_25540 [Burk